ncbi:unnamed protein product, partial [Mesorhabditis belari]|uniref:Uncharacterized protein n=1 Tax=Mesorhabditis belari TaxID=2138241 RepID=A0AAF3J8U5_9BILA
MIMVVITHSITICFLVGNLLMNRVLQLAILPGKDFLSLEVYPFVLHCILSCVVIVFNKQWKQKRKSTTVSVG